jgi:nucleotide-binding universal stress UspA family protein
VTTFKHLMVPLDGCRLAETVLPATIWLAERFQAEVILFHVIEKNAPSVVHGDVHLSCTADAEEYLTKTAQRLTADGLIVERHVHTVEAGNVAQSILFHAEEMGTDLIILTAHGSGGWRDRIVGGIAQQVLAGGCVPVLLLRPERVDANPQFAPRQILVPLDGAPDHEAALPAAKAIARAGRATIHLVTVVPTPGTLSGERAAPGALLPTTTQAILDLAQDRAAEHLEALLQDLAQEGIQATAEVARGDVATEISKVAGRVRADLIVLATHGRTALDAFWTGSVSPRILSGVGAPVLLVHELKHGPDGRVCGESAGSASHGMGSGSDSE